MIVTDVPPANGPAVGLSRVTVARVGELTAEDVATCRPAWPPSRSPRRDPGGLVAVICVSVSLTIVVAGAPKSTVVAPVRFAPVIVTDVPPADGPAAGIDARHRRSAM